MMDCLSDRLTTPEDVITRDELDILSIPLTPTSLMPSSARSNLQAIDFDPFVDGELALTAPATESQQEIWLGVQMSPAANLACILSQALQIGGRLNVKAMQSAIRQLIDRHESLRATFSSDGMTISIAKAVNFELPIEDLSALSTSDRAAAIDRYQQQAVTTPFDLQHGPLFRAQLLKLSDLEHLLLWDVHHLICDGWSLGILISDLTAIYNSLNRGTEIDLAQPEYFSEYTFAERAQVGTPEAIATTDYWLQKFAELPPVLDLPTDYPRPPVRTFNSSREYYTLPANLVAQIEKLGVRNGCSLMTTLLSAFEVFLFKLTGQTDLTVGVPTSGQLATGKYNLVGHCVNFLPLRSRIDPQIAFGDYLKSRNRAILDDYEHQNFTFGSLLQKLAIPRDASRIPLVPAVFNIDLDGGSAKSTFDELTTALVFNRGEFATFEFFLNAATTASGQIDLDCQYNTNLFSAASIQRRLGEFANLLTQIVATPDRSLQALSLLNAAQVQQLLVDWNTTQTDYPQTEWIDRLFEQQVAESGESIALVYQDRQLTYRELNERANRLAHYLLAIGVKSGELVGIALDRSIDTIVAILAILKAGGAYLPLDLSYPAERLAFMLENAKVSVLVTQTAVRDRLPAHAARSIDLDKDGAEIDRASATNPHRSGQAADLAYVMYTSGSTGQPKGVCIPHRGVVRLVKNTNYLDFSPSQTWLQLAPIAFDASTLEIWGSLLNGGKLVLFPGEKPSLRELGQTIATHQITTLWLTAGLFHLMVDERIEDLRPLRQLIAGGDVLSMSQVRKVLATLPDCQLINGYGPTENTTFTCCYPISSLDGLSAVPIGKPIANTQVYVLDTDGQPVPIGIPGELYIGGDGLARGYLARPDLTSEKFVANPFATGQQLYRTGDLVRYLPDGNLEFLGRIDTQVKIRGFRIELGEIDAVLAQHPAVREVRTIDREDRPGDKRLVAYLVIDPTVSTAAIDWRSFLQSKLPDYLIPSAFVIVAALPLTANGKVDRRALPMPESDRPTDPQTLVAPRDEVERQLTEIWERVLDVRPIGMRDNFFAIGGHSLLAVRLFAEIDRIWGQNLPLATLLQAQTIEDLAKVLGKQASKPASIATWSSLVLIQSGGPKPPLFCIHPIGGNILEYYTFATYLDREQPIYGLQSQGLDGLQQPFRRVEDMASHYIKEIRTIQPHGPYFLLGYSFGGLVAYEMACQLKADGEQIQMLALLDCSAPNLPTRRPALAQSLKIHLCNLWQLNADERSNYIMGRISYRLTRDNERDFLAKSLYKPEDLTPQLFNVLDANLQASEDYIARPYGGKLTLFRCQVQDLEHYLHPEFGWRDLVGDNLNIYQVPGSHFRMMKEPRVRGLAAEIRSCLQLLQPDAEGDEL
jgi:amino acid adenylation domain-containing protein